MNQEKYPYDDPKKHNSWMNLKTAGSALFWIAAAALIGSCTYKVYWPDPSIKQKEQARAERNRLAAQAVAKGPTSREWPLENGTLTEITIPYLLLGVLPETRTCYVWQNEFTKAAAMSCDYDKASPGMMEPPDNGIER